MLTLRNPLTDREVEIMGNTTVAIEGSYDHCECGHYRVTHFHFDQCGGILPLDECWRCDCMEFKNVEPK